jgi:type I pantothenate kinase
VDDLLRTLAERVAEALRSEPPHLVGIGGAVAVGKSTIAAGLADKLSAMGRGVHVVATDAFLHPNDVLRERNLTFRKGFPETFDVDAILGFAGRIRDGSPRVEIPVYSHEIYDIVLGEHTVLAEPDLVVLEGVIALQHPVVDVLDVSIYVDADEANVREWFVSRFLALTETARNDPSSFYRLFADMGTEEVRRVAEGTWDSINGVNLHEHIAPSRAHAMFVVEKGADHSVRAISGA